MTHQSEEVVLNYTIIGSDAVNHKIPAHQTMYVCTASDHRCLGILLFRLTFPNCIFSKSFLLLFFWCRMFLYTPIYCT